MASTSTTAVAAAALAVFGCAVGLLLGRWTFATSASERPVEQSALIDLTPLLTEIKRSNDALLTALRENEPTAPISQVGTREPANVDSSALHRLAAALEKNNEILERNGRSVSASSHGVSASWKGSGYPSLAIMADRINGMVGAGDPKWLETIRAELGQRHLGWTRDDLFERYGAPSGLYSNQDGLSVAFRVQDDPKRPHFVRFLTAEGLVTNGWYD